MLLISPSCNTREQKINFKQLKIARPQKWPSEISDAFLQNKYLQKLAEDRKDSDIIGHISREITIFDSTRFPKITKPHYTYKIDIEEKKKKTSLFQKIKSFF